MCSWLNLGALDLHQQAAVRWLRDDHGLYVKRHAIIREMVICLSLLPDGSRAQICAFMSFWSKTEITATAPICFHAWQLYPLTYSGTFASPIDLWMQWSQLTGVPKFSFSPETVRYAYFILCSRRQSGLFFCWEHYSTHTHTHVNAHTVSLNPALTWQNVWTCGKKKLQRQFDRQAVG